MYVGCILVNSGWFCDEGEVFMLATAYVSVDVCSECLYAG